MLWQGLSLLPESLQQPRTRAVSTRSNTVRSGSHTAPKTFLWLFHNQLLSSHSAAPSGSSGRLSWSAGMATYLVSLGPQKRENTAPESPFPTVVFPTVPYVLTTQPLSPVCLGLWWLCFKDLKWIPSASLSSPFSHPARGSGQPRDPFTSPDPPAPSTSQSLCIPQRKSGHIPPRGEVNSSLSCPDSVPAGEN